MANVLFSRTDSPSTKPITDGQIIFDTSGNGKMYLDNGTTRLEMGGAINVDATLDATSTNPIQNKGVAGVMLSELEEVRGVTKKGFLTDALATKTLDAKIGTTDISSIGDGTVTGAINDVNGKLSNYQNIESKLVWEAGARPSNVTAYKKGREVNISFQCAVTITSGTVIPIFKVPYTIKVSVYQPMTVSNGIGTPLGSCNGIMATDSYFKIASPINGGYVSGTVQFLIDDE